MMKGERLFTAEVGNHRLSAIASEMSKEANQCML
jgi:hypothetical protein